MLRTLLTQLLRRAPPTPALAPTPPSPSITAPRATEAPRPAVSVAVALDGPMVLPLERVEPPASLRQGLTATAQVTLLLPTVASREQFLRSTLAHLDVAMPGVDIVVSDHTEHGDQEAVKKVVGEYPRLRARIIHHPASMHFLHRLSDCARAAPTPFVVVHADDDYMLPASLDESITFLQNRPDHVCCQGRTFFLKLRAPRFCSPKVHGATSRREDAGAERIVNQCSNFSPTLYAVTRREAFIEANEAALRYTSNVVFWQYLSSCLLLAKGKSHVLDSLYYLRLDNPDGWRATLIRSGDRTHWPHLVVAPEFSQELTRFKAGLSAALVATGATDVQITVDDCCLALIRRAFNSAWQKEDAEVDLLLRATTTGSTENQIIRYSGSLALAALTRIHAKT
jgi:glycosyltransferase domain-containing protein